MEAHRRRDEIATRTGITRGAALRKILKGDKRLREAYAAAYTTATDVIADEAIRNATKASVQNTDRHAREQLRASRRNDRAARQGSKGGKSKGPTKLDPEACIKKLKDLPAIVEPPGMVEARRARVTRDLLDRGALEEFVNVDLRRLHPALPAGYLAVARRLLELLNKPQLIALGGGRGRGKSSIATGVMRAFTEEGRIARYATAKTFLRVMSSGTFDQRRETFRCFESADFVVIDEYQDRAATEREEAELQDMIDQRYGHKRPTLLVTNLEALSFEHNLGPKLLRRLNDQGGFHQSEWGMIKPLLEGEAA